MSELNFISIDHLDHPLLEEWKHVYYDAFPRSERMTWGFFEKVIPAEERNHYVWAATQDDKFVALFSYGFDETEQSGNILFLWYLATAPALRNQGIGHQVMTEIKRLAQEAGCSAVVFEVNIPSEASNAEDAEFDRRRIGFYQRQGAFLIEGIHYEQSVDQPDEKPIPMHLMLIPLCTLDSPAIEDIILSMEAEIVGDITLQGLATQ
jgi:GNAT superfamily N-acetyltransferase